MINEQRLLDSFMEMTKITSKSKEERAMIDYLKQEFDRLGLRYQEDNAGAAIEGNAGNLFVFLPGIDEQVTGSSKHKKKLLFTAHVDTVIPCENIEPVVKDGYVYSAGETILSADDKGGVAAILEMFKVLVEQRRLVSTDASLLLPDIQAVFTVAEEIGLCGVKNCDTSLIDANLGIALDSSGDPGTIVIQGPEHLKMDVTIKGKAAHAGIEPEAGISAIEVAAHAIANMKLGRLDEETTANIGVIEGGKATNIVCPEVKIRAEVRSLDPAKAKAQIQAMTDSLQSVAVERGARVEIEIQEDYPAFCYNEDDEQVKVVKQAVERAGLTVDCIKSGGGSDASIFNKLGVPTLNLGIGMEKVHTTDERIAIKSLNNTARLLLEIVKA